MAVLPAVVGREQGVQGGEQVVVTAGAGLDDRDPCRGVRDEDVEQAVAAGRRLAQEGLAVTGDVGDPLRRAGGEVEDSGGEGIGHVPILTPGEDRGLRHR